MVRKPRARLRPMAELNQRQKNERRFARRLGFRNEVSYRNWVKKYSSLPESDPRYFRRSMRGDAREAEIKRLKKIITRSKSSAKQIIHKADLLVYGESEKISPVRFWDSFGNQIRSALADPQTSQRDKAALKRLMKRLNEDMSVPEHLQPGEQATLFGR